MKHWHHDIDKPIVYKIHEPKGKPNMFLDQAVKMKAHVPPPNTYNMQRNFIIKQNMMNSKSPRTLESEEIAHQAKRIKHPEAATYKPKHKAVEKRLIGCFNLQCDRSGYLEEAARIGKEQAPFANKKYTQVDPKFKHVNIYKPSTPKK